MGNKDSKQKCGDKEQSIWDQSPRWALGTQDRHYPQRAELGSSYQWATEWVTSACVIRVWKHSQETRLSCETFQLCGFTVSLTLIYNCFCTVAQTLYLQKWNMYIWGCQGPNLRVLWMPYKLQFSHSPAYFLDSLQQRFVELSFKL